MPWYAYIGYAIVFAFLGCVVLMVLGAIVAGILHLWYEDRSFFWGGCIFLLGIVLLAMAAFVAQ